MHALRTCCIALAGMLIAAWERGTARGLEEGAPREQQGASCALGSRRVLVRTEGGTRGGRNGAADGAASAQQRSCLSLTMHRIDIACVAVLAAMLAAVLSHVNTHVPAPYMDEVFHAAQTQRYCAADTTWDAKITTLPGLYVAGAVYAHARQCMRVLWHAITHADWAEGAVLGELCDVRVLREVNVLFALALFVLLVALRREHSTSAIATTDSTREDQSDGAGMLRRDDAARSAADDLLDALDVWISPPLAFFYALYYTDVGALCFVLLVYLLAWQGRPILSSMCGAIAVLFRQTNVVWVGVAMLLMLLRPHMAPNPSAAAPSPSESAWRCIPFLLCAAAFAAFVLLNGSVALGDKDAHAASLHLMQPFYFASFVHAERLVAHGVGTVRALLSMRLLQKVLCFVIIGVAALYCAHYYTMEHEYLLADNRHYVFYIWKNSFRRFPWFRYAVAPVHAIAALCLAAQQQQRTWGQVMISSCIALGACAVLVPARLLEVRYFLVPWALLSLHARPVPRATRCCSIALKLCATAAMLFVFVHRPFRWADGSVARFMW